MVVLIGLCPLPPPLIGLRPPNWATPPPSLKTMSKTTPQGGICNLLPRQHHERDEQHSYMLPKPYDNFCSSGATFQCRSTSCGFVALIYLQREEQWENKSRDVHFCHLKEQQWSDSHWIIWVCVSPDRYATCIGLKMTYLIREALSNSDCWRKLGFSKDNKQLFIHANTPAKMCLLYVANSWLWCNNNNFIVCGYAGLFSSFPCEAPHRTLESRVEWRSCFPKKWIFRE